MYNCISEKRVAAETSSWTAEASNPRSKEVDFGPGVLIHCLMFVDHSICQCCGASACINRPFEHEVAVKFVSVLSMPPVAVKFEQMHPPPTVVDGCRLHVRAAVSGMLRRIAQPGGIAAGCCCSFGAVATKSALEKPQ